MRSSVVGRLKSALREVRAPFKPVHMDRKGNKGLMGIFCCHPQEADANTSQHMKPAFSIACLVLLGRRSISTLKRCWGIGFMLRPLRLPSRDTCVCPDPLHTLYYRMAWDEPLRVTAPLPMLTHYERRESLDKLSYGHLVPFVSAPTRTFVPVGLETIVDIAIRPST